MNIQNSHPKQSKKDWHVADIKAALEKAGWSLSRLSIHHGYASRNTLKTALRKPWPKGEKLIADAINTSPETIWPSRYIDGRPNRMGCGPKPKQNSDATINFAAELRRHGTSLPDLARRHGYRGSISNVTRRRWPAAERIVADVLGMEPWDIWPTRYHPDHTPVRDPRGRKSKLPVNESVTDSAKKKAL